MPSTNRTAARLTGGWVWLLAFAVTAGVAIPAWAQSDNPLLRAASRVADAVGGDGDASSTQAVPPAEAGLVAEVDVITLLMSDQVFPATIEDKIWTVRPGAGRRLVQIPVKIKPGKKPADISTQFIDVSGGRFVCFRLDDRGEGGNLVQQAIDEHEQYRQGSARIAAELQEKGSIYDGTPPMISRRPVIMPDGSVHFKIDRTITRDSELKGGDGLYLFRLDRPRLNDKRPEPPPRSTPRTAQERAQMQAAQIDFRSRMAEYLELMKTVNGMSDDIELPGPDRLWIVFELPDSRNTLDISGPKPLPWSIEVPVLQMLRDTAASEVQTVEGPDGRQRLAAGDIAKVIQLSSLSNDRHPYTQRMIALALVESALIHHAQFGDPLFVLLRAILEGTDGPARSTVIGELTTTVPRSLGAARARAELLKLIAAGAVVDSGEKIAALQGLVTSNLASDPDQAQRMITTANNMLSDKAGPAPEEVLKPLLDAARGQPTIVPMFTRNLQFHTLDDQRLDEALVFVVENAGAEPLAASWLNEKFLSSANRALLSRALGVIANADAGARDLGPLINRGVEALFGMPRSADGGQFARKARLRMAIPIYTINDGIYRALQHGDPAIRELAWRAIGNFTVPLLEDEPISERDRYKILVDAALDQVPTPVQVVGFLAQQPNKDRVTETLVQVALRGGRGAQAAAIRALIGSGGSLDRVMLRMREGERQGFAMLVYEVAYRQPQPPLVANVLRRRDPNNPVAAWFGSQVASGVVPEPAAWLEASGGEDKVLELLVSNDPDLRRGAAGVLVASAGGTDRAAVQFIERIATMSDQTRDSVRDAWHAQRAELFAVYLQRYEGNYQIILRLRDAAAPPEAPARELALGVVQLMVNVPDRTVSLGSSTLAVAIGDRRDMIRVTKPTEIRNLPNEQVASLPLDGEKPPMDMLRQRDGSWVGSMTLDDGQIAQLIMVPARTQAGR